MKLTPTSLSTAVPQLESSLQISTSVTYIPTLKLEFFADEENKAMVKEYTCPLCNGICYDPLIDQCGHMFCRKCYNLFTETQIDKKQKCPIISSSLSSPPVPLNVVAKVINDRIILCKNKLYGCTWKGTVKQFIDHVENTCAKEKVKCSSPGCNVIVKRSKVQEHYKICEYRTMKCKCCDNDISMKSYPSHHLACPKVKVLCPNYCGAYFEREKLNMHISNNCPKTNYDCDFAKIGCCVTLKQNEMQKHNSENMTEHLKLLLNYVVKMAEQFEDVKKIFYIMIDSNNNINSNIEGNISAIKQNDKNDTQSIQTQNMLSILNMTLQKDKSDSFVNRKRFREDIETNINDQDHNSKKNQNIIKTSNDIDYPIELGAIQLSNELISAEPKSIYDIELIPSGVSISDNVITFISNSKSEHKYVFSTLKIDKDKSTSWKISLITQSSWIAFGLCDKEKVLSNKMKFFSVNRQFNHGSFLISTNNYLWNCNIEKENNFHLASMPKIQKNKDIIFTYTPKDRILNFKFESFNGKLTDVRPLLDDHLTICIVFLHSGDSVVLSSIE